MKKWLIALTGMLSILSCKSKKTDPEKQFISVHSYFQNQVADVDTSLYPIIRLDIIDSARTDTTYIRREDFRAEAADFLSLPDISDKKYRDDYTEQNRYDETLDRVIITYLPVNAAKAPIQRQEMLLVPSPGNADVKTIIVDFLISNKDSIVQKRMLWQMNRSFQVTTIKQVVGSPETISTKKVVWNEPENQ